MGRSYRGQNKREKKRNKKTKGRTKEYVSFIGQIVKISRRDPDTSVFTFRFLLVPEDLKKPRHGSQINEIWDTQGRRGT